jgi:hypothetical protein
MIGGIAAAILIIDRLTPIDPPISIDGSGVAFGNYIDHPAMHALSITGPTLRL